MGPFNIKNRNEMATNSTSLAAKGFTHLPTSRLIRVMIWESVPSVKKNRFHNTHDSSIV